MFGPDSSEPSLEMPAEMTGNGACLRAGEAFSTLGHETRLAILLALWDADEPFAAENAVPFAALRERVGVRDGSKFNYHLKQLLGHFVRKTGDGYELRPAGHRLVQSVIASAGVEDPALDPTEVDQACPVCDAPTAITYHDERLVIVCTECEGRFGDRGRLPEGTLASVDLDPAGIAARQPEELLDVANFRGAWRLQSWFAGVCDACSGPMDRWLHRCEDHATDGVCRTCGRRYAVMARFCCPVCKNRGEYTPSCSWLVMHHPAVVAFYADHGVPLQLAVDESGRVQPRYREIDPNEDFEHELVSEEPLRVRVRIRYEGAELALTLDEHVNVVDVRERT